MRFQKTASTVASTVAAVAALGVGALLASSASATMLYENLTPNNLMAMASRPVSPGAFEIESADDFLLTSHSIVNSASFTGLFVPSPNGGPFSVSQVVVEIYRVFPLDSNTARTPQVPTRANSPSDVELVGRDSATAGQLSFTTSILNNTFTALNSVQPGGIHASPNQTTGGNGAVTGQEVQFDVNFTTPFDLPADHYFFVPQVLLSNGANFYWLSASRPISGPGTTPFTPDLQAWTRDSNLDPDWLRVGTDIVGASLAPAPTFNAAFLLNGTALTVPEPASLALIAVALAAAGGGVRRRRAR